jgi:hypothetical protein
MKKYIILSVILLAFSTTSSAVTFNGFFPILQQSQPGIGGVSSLFHETRASGQPYDSELNTQYKLVTDFDHKSSYDEATGALSLYADVIEKGTRDTILDTLHITGTMDTDGSPFDLNLELLNGTFASDLVTFTPKPEAFNDDGSIKNIDINIFKLPNTYLWGAGDLDGSRLQVDLGFDPMPIPSTLALMGLGLAGFGTMRARAKNQLII